LRHIQADFQKHAQRELRVFFDQEEIRGMEDWRLRILQGLRDSHLLLACLSPGYLASQNCKWEFNEYLKHEIGRAGGSHGVVPVYLVEVPSWEQKGDKQQNEAWADELRRRQYFDLRLWYDQGAAALLEAAVQERMAELSHRIWDAIQHGERAARSPGNVEAHNPHFVGRRRPLRQLRQNFVEPGRISVLTAVHGMGGLGKTALATEYAHAYAEEYGGGRWLVRCAGREDLRLALAELAPAVGFEFTEDEKKSADRLFERVRRELQQLAAGGNPPRCLLILDNVDQPGLLDPAMVARLNGGDWLHVLATTRLGENELGGTHRDRAFLPLDELPGDEALALMESYQPGGRFRHETERAAAAEIVRRLGNFTLAVEAAAVYLGQYGGEVSCAAFLARLEREGLLGLDQAVRQGEVRVRHGEGCLSATLAPTLERLGEEERLVLRLAALLPSDQVALPWLRGLAARTFPELGRDAEPGYPDPWNRVVRRLLSLRLLQVTPGVDGAGQPRVVRIHRLVQELMLRDCDGTEREALQRAVDKWMEQRAAALAETTRWEEVRWELEPFTAMAVQWAEQNHPRASWLLIHAGQRRHDLAEWIQAEPLMRRALAIEEARYGLEHPKVAIGLHNLAQLLQATNRLPEAEPLMRRALAIDEASYEPKHRKVAACLNNLATLLQDTNRLPEAELLMRQALKITKASYGPKHPNVATCLNNLAILLQATNRLQKAELLMRQALKITKASYGPKHPNVATCLNNLATLLQATNRLQEAEPLILEALAIDEVRYGPEHPNVATDLNNLGQLLKATNRLEEAEPLMRRGLEILVAFTRTTRHRHPHLQAGVGNYIELLRALGRSEAQIRATLRALGPELFSG
jgi:tetratricopeptide (TPR) repeat protein